MFEDFKLKIGFILVRLAFRLGGPGAVIFPLSQLMNPDEIRPELWFEEAT